MSHLLRLKPSPLKQFFSTAHFSTSARLSVPKTREEKLRVLELGEAIHAEITNTTGRDLFLSQFNGDEAAARQKYSTLSAEEKERYKQSAASENQKRKEREKNLTPEERKLLEQYAQATENSTLNEKKMQALASNIPKKMTGSYALFVKENFARVAKASSEQGGPRVNNILAQEWSSMQESQKQSYRQKRAAHAKQYEVDYDNWVKTLSEDERVLLGSRGQKYLTNAQRGALLNAPVSPRHYFFKDAFAPAKWTGGNNQQVFADITREAHGIWKAPSPEQRQAYKSV